MYSSKFKAFLPIIFSLGLILFYYFKRIVVVKYYPATIDFIFFLIFFISLFQEKTIIQKIAFKLNPNLNKKEEIYTRNLTYVWVIFLFFNFLIALITIFLSDRIWIIYNGFISYFLVGSLFIIEYIVRIIFRKKHLI